MGDHTRRNDQNIPDGANLTRKLVDMVVQNLTTHKGLQTSTIIGEPLGSQVRLGDESKTTTYLEVHPYLQRREPEYSGCHYQLQEFLQSVAFR